MTAALHESFDNGVGILDHTWGNVDTSVPGQITLWDNSGAMQWPSGTDAGNGYGRYEVTASMSADQVGPAALLWPADDKWPGPEYDIVEVLKGTPYGVVHWKDGGGGDSYEAHWFDGVDETQTHTYAIEWREGHIDFFIDGQHYGTVDHNVGADYAHGGVNAVLSAMNSNPSTHLTVYDMSYTPFGSEDTGAQTAAAPTAAPIAAATDWASVAAAITEYHARTGLWASYEDIAQAEEASKPTSAEIQPATATGEVDWNQQAAVVEAYHAETGLWTAYQQIIDSGWIA